jgi:hypothetical protein
LEQCVPNIGRQNVLDIDFVDPAIPKPQTISLVVQLAVVIPSPAERESPLIEVLGIAPRWRHGCDELVGGLAERRNRQIRAPRVERVYFFGWEQSRRRHILIATKTF